MIERYKIVFGIMALLLLLGVCGQIWSAEDKIALVQKQVSDLEEQKTELETEKGKLVAEGDKLSLKIDTLKMQARGGLGIIGRFKLSRSLRKAQSLSEKIRALEKQIQKVKSELRDKKKELEGEYERQIALLMERLGKVSQTEEKAGILKKVKEYQTAKDKLAEPEEEELGHLDITKIEIQEYDGPQEIREKADLINDFATKLKNRMDMLNARAKKLEVEFKTRERLGEFAEEISFFGERISREEVVSDAGKEVTEKPDETPVEVTTEEPVVVTADANMPIRVAEDATLTGKTETPITVPPETTETPVTMEVQTSEAKSRMVVERNGVSTGSVVISLEQIRREIELLKRQEQALKKELATLLKKADSFYEKADEIEKSETKKGEQKGTGR